MLELGFNPDPASREGDELSSWPKARYGLTFHDNSCVR